MNFFQKNMECLKAYRVTIYKTIKDGISYEDEKVSVLNAKNNEKILVYNSNNKSVYLNSRYNPVNEAEKFIEDDINIPDEAIYTMFGISNGIFAKEFITKMKNNSYCFIYEPSLQIFMTTLNNFDITELIKSDRVGLFVCGINDTAFNLLLGEAVETYNIENNKYVALPKYKELFPDEYAEYSKVINDICDRKVISTQTAIRHGKRVCENNIFNLRYLKGCRSGREFVGLFPEELPAVVVSAGPSLEKNMKLLKEIKQKALIVVVDRAVNKVLSEGIRPDIVVSVDFMKPVDLFQGEGIKDIPLLIDSDFNTEVLDYLSPSYLIFGGSDSLIYDDLFKKVGSEIYEIKTSGSVATFAISNLIAWGFKKIILIGQDLALTDNRVHVGEEKKEFDLNDSDYFYVDAIGGGSVLTRKDYYIYIKWIEDTAEQLKDILEIVDATEGGAFKNNTKVMKFSEAIEKYCDKICDIAGIINGVPRLFLDDETLVFDKLLEIKNNLNNMRRLMISGASDCNMARKMLLRGEYDRKKLRKVNSVTDRLDKLILNSQERTIVSKYLISVDYNFYKDIYNKEEDAIQDAIKIYEKSENYYREVSDAIPNIIEIVDRCIKKMNVEQI